MEWETKDFENGMLLPGDADDLSGETSEELAENEALVCGENCPHYGAIACALHAMPAEEEMDTLTEFFKVFADTSRLRIISALYGHELCVCDICEALSMNQSAVSHQLRILRAAKLVKYRRSGKQIYYSLDDNHIAGIISMALSHIREERKK